MRNRERALALIALASVIVAWFIGWQRYDTELAPLLQQSLPGADRFEECGPGIFAGRKTTEAEQPIVGYVAIGQGTGYGGPMKVVVGINLEGNVVGLTVVEHQETAAYFQRAGQTGLPENLIGKKYSDPFIPGQDIDAVTGATMTVTAMADSVSAGARSVAGNALNLPLPPKAVAPIKFGLPEITLLSLFGVALFSQTRRLRRNKLVRWICLLTGLVVLGFMVNGPLTLTNVSSLLIGYWPAWQSHLYWYLLIVGVLVLPLVIGRNLYCGSICPFGATQQCLGAIGGAKSRRLSARWRARLRWIPRILAWAAILIALTYRNPALVSYEVYGTLFGLVGSHFQFGLLAAVLVASLFIKRPWCNYLCPIRGVTDLVKLGFRRPVKRTQASPAVMHVGESELS